MAGGCLAAVAFATSLLTPPAAADLTDTAPPQADFTLTITSIGSASKSRSAQLTLTCDKDGGTHPTPTDACDSLRAVEGNFRLLPRVDGVACPEVYAPVRVEATGYWRTFQVEHSEVFGNTCEAAVGTDNVFNFADWLT